MKKIALVCLLLLNGSVMAEVDLFPDESVRQFILIQNNAEKCFQPKLWRARNAKNDEEYNSILNQRSEMETISASQYEIALMTELFGEEATVQIFENPTVQEQFNEKLSRLSTDETTVNTPQECESLSQYYLRIRQKHIF
ncbi:hypothetical protein CBG46_08145 [Actinobacillus succinogenes]|uniref:Uncharacterized protein n=1 Tax=Actinobacillus succinogenes (strain ATCC 55618 / DSM 22257 / CCUG 43843 / 130Z) TaxID=339671 RepID=A6VPQ1_ACTSZ|nr:hypothetical protein [Actinobacillus succinogenes]ABR74948.1 hypothetical protein Asuc_1594 [Actinobacillus succinogenes 130Z]PHI40641.1 hypothetical protein CBG46_08145 [Actinobacillus succinogenes]